MKTILGFFSFLFLLAGCQNAVKKPGNLIEEDKMVNIIYDLALLEGIKSRNPADQKRVNPNAFIYKKYNIVSLQFAKSNQFYASDIRKYKKMYEEVGARIDKNKAHIDLIINKTDKNKAPKNKKDDKPTVL